MKVFKFVKKSNSLCLLRRRLRGSGADAADEGDDPSDDDGKPINEKTDEKREFEPKYDRVTSEASIGGCPIATT